MSKIVPQWSRVIHHSLRVDRKTHPGTNLAFAACDSELMEVEYLQSRPPNIFHVPVQGQCRTVGRDRGWMAEALNELVEGLLARVDLGV